MSWEFDWDAASIEHIARHRVAPREVEQVFANEPMIVGAQEHAAEERFLCFGRTNTGRFLTVIYTERHGKIRVVTLLSDDAGTAANVPDREVVMAGKKITIPKFRSEKEEAEWWDAHPEVATRLLKNALRQGTVQRRPGETRLVTMRVPVRDLEAARELAERKGLPYQTYMKMLLHQALEKERAAG